MGVRPTTETEHGADALPETSESSEKPPWWALAWPARIVRRIEAHPALFHGANLVTALAFAIWALEEVRELRGFLAQTHANTLLALSLSQWPQIALLALRNAAFMVSLIARRRTTRIAMDAPSFLCAHFAMWFPYFYEYRPEAHMSARIAVPLQVIMTVGTLFSVLAVVSLGRSVGILPANRGVQTRGLYRFVRHPMYASYILTNVALCAGWPSWRNVVITMAAAGSQILRAFLEERLLTEDATYRAYQARTPYMFLPKVL